MNDVAIVWKSHKAAWLLLLLVVPLLGLIYYHGLASMVSNWLEKDEYSHGIFIPFLSLLLVWQKRDELSRIDSQASWGGVALTLAGILALFIGEISAITAITQFSLIVVLAGLTLSALGREYFGKIWIAFLFLVFTIPIPQVIYNNLSQTSQLVSSAIGVGIIRLFDISVYLEGNVIDLGSMKLQVIEACSGLRYLFPLMSLAFIGAYFYRDVMWKRVLIFLSSIPIAILLNSLRIGMIGVTVEYWGQAAAEGFLHDFEGWVMFMACLSVLVLEMWLLTKVGGGRKTLGQIFAIEIPEAPDYGQGARTRRLQPAYFVSIALLCVTAVAIHFISERVNAYPERSSFMYFPAVIGEWKGHPQTLDLIIQDRLDFDDYIISNYTDKSGNVINLYIAYYEEQRKGASIHSPRACLPGGGWEIKSLADFPISTSSGGAQPLMVNRVIIRKGEAAQLVYYWFKQRERNETGEFAIKWWLFWDALSRNRTDGALIRLTSILQPGEDIESADRKLMEFARLVYPLIPEYVPD